MHITITLNDKAEQIVKEYSEANTCSRSKAINDLILRGNEKEGLMKYIKAIYKNTKK